MDNDLIEKKQIAAALRALQRRQRVNAFDAFRPDTRANKKQEEIMRDIQRIQYRFVVAGNQSGKSQLAAREIAWLVSRSHPYIDVDAIQGDEPLLILIAGQDLTMMATELWGAKIAPFLDLSEWKPEKQGNTLKKVVNKKTGDTIIFLSHSDGSDSN